MPTYVLAVPPSTNNLYANVGKGRRKKPAYSAWIRGELKALVAQRARPVEPPVSLHIVLPEKTRGDASNRIKPCEDLLVKAGVIPDDRKAFVRSVTVDFGPVENM